MSEVQDGAHTPFGELDFGEEVGTIHGEPMEDSEGEGGGGEENSAFVSLVSGQRAYGIAHALAERKVGV